MVEKMTSPYITEWVPPITNLLLGHFLLLMMAYHGGVML